MYGGLLGRSSPASCFLKPNQVFMLPKPNKACFGACKPNHILLAKPNRAFLVPQRNQTVTEKLQ